MREATACNAFVSATSHGRSPNLMKPRTPTVVVPWISGTMAIET